MTKKLVIVESPAKAKTINKILGAEYTVKSSMGHVRDLPVKKLGIDIEDNFRPQYTVLPGRRKVVNEIMKVAAQAEAVYLAPDPDREGEAIAWHLKEILSRGAGSRKFFRVQYNEITASAVRKAFAEPGDIDMKRVEAQQARRILDRLVGYKVSPVLWRNVKRGLSAGRVQSVALRLLCEREEAIRNFVPEEFWIIGALVRKLAEPREPFRARLVEIGGEKAEVRTGEQAAGIRADLEGRKLRVASVSTRDIVRRPPPPHITSTLQQAASGVYGFSPKRTMLLAQRLYEGVDVGGGPVGLITYMRTDSYAVSREAQAACREFVLRQYGAEYCPAVPNVFRNKAGSQAAHEAIRPTDVNRTPESLKGRIDPDLLKVYRLVWNRFVASQMAPAVISRRTVVIEAQAEPQRPTVYRFQAACSEPKFPGYMKVAGIETPKPDEKAEGEVEQTLPPLAEGESLECVEWLSERKETQPPPRYSEASLVRALEAKGIGRPSTYAQIIATLHQREYVRLERKTLVPTELGERVNRLLVGRLEPLFNVQFTAMMEESLDRIEEGKVSWTAMLADFYGKFTGWLKNVESPAADRELSARIARAVMGVKEWDPPVKRGRRTYSDRDFVESLSRQIGEGKAVSLRQFEALVRIGAKYREQIPELEAILAEAGMTNLLEKGGIRPVCEATLNKLRAASTLDLDEKTARFVASIAGQVERGRSLTDAQMAVLDRILSAHASKIEGFDALNVKISSSDAPAEEDAESRKLVEALSSVTRWREPVSRGRRVFDDEAFYKSVAAQFSRKRRLSDKQKAALRKMAARYRDQIPGYEEQMKPASAIPEKQEGSV